MSIKTSFVAAGLAACLAAPAAFAFGPFGAAQIVHAEAPTSAAPCPGFTTGTSFDTALLPDGTSAALTIPAGLVLVVTRVEVLGFGAGAGAFIQTRLWRARPGEAEIASRRETVADGTGRVFQFYEFSPGLVVASGTTVCLNSNTPSLTMTGHLQGFFKRSN